MKRPLSRLACASLLIATLASCSIGYNHRWKKLAADNAAHPPKDLSGAWEGTWKSETTGHTGTLRAIVDAPIKVDAKTADYLFHYRATWKKILSSVFVAHHDATPKGKGYVLSGHKDLGRFGGDFKFTGTATPKEFHAQYQSKSDHGEFEMKRPQ